MPRWVWLLCLIVVLLGVAGLMVIRDPDVVTPSPKVRNFKNIHVEVLNGCGKDGIARQVGSHLRSLGFDVMTVGDAESFNYPESLVIDRVGNPGYARCVAEALGTANLIQQINPDLFRIEEITVIIGRDFRRLGLLQRDDTPQTADYRQ